MGRGPGGGARSAMRPPRTVMQFRRVGVRFARRAAGIAAVALAVSLCVPNALPSFLSAIDLSRLSSFKYEAGRYLGVAADAEEVNAPSVVGSLVPVDTRRRDVDEETYFLLDKRLRASHPDEVGTVALLSWKVDREGGWGGASTGVAEVRLLDLGARMIVGRTTIVGEDGELPRAEVARYLNALPRSRAASR